MDYSTFSRAFIKGNDIMKDDDAWQPPELRLQILIDNAMVWSRVLLDNTLLVKVAPLMNRSRRQHYVPLHRGGDRVL